MTGCYLAQPDGRIIFAEWEVSTTPEVETDERLQNMALAEGSRRYPELAALVPQRPRTAVTCSYCGGTGALPGAPVDGVLCYCGGLGWVPGNNG
jgi:phytoene dehydrogenase-like protein